jgi:hypothetical protein
MYIINLKLIFNLDIDSRLDYINCGDSDIIIVEYLDSKEKEPNCYFEVKKIIFEEGICPGCNDATKKMLINPCSCKEVSKNNINFLILIFKYFLGLVL